MAVFVEVETDPFRTIASEEAQDARAYEHPDIPPVRRPLRGIEISEPTWSYIKVIDRNGSLWYLAASGDRERFSPGTSNYFLQSLALTRAEKSQIVLTFGETFVFFFGEQPIQANIQGSLLRSEDFPWFKEFMLTYEHRFRGTKLADLGARVYLYVDGMVLEGLMMSVNFQKTADLPHLVPFNFSLLLTNLIFAETTSYTDFPRRRQYIEGLDLVETYGQLGAQFAEEQREMTESQYGVAFRQKNEAAYRKQIALFRLQQAVGMFEVATTAPFSPLKFTGVIDPSTFEQLDPRGVLSGTSPVPASTDESMQRQLPLRSKIVDNVDEYLRLPYSPPPDTTVGDATGSMEDAEAAGDAGMHPPEETAAGMDAPEAAVPETAEEAETPLQETLGGSPGQDVSHGSGLTTLTDIPVI